MALEHEGPTVLALTRQNLPTMEKSDSAWKQSMRRGAYVMRESKAAGRPELVVVATGSEVSLAIEAVEMSGRDARVVSMPSRELFLAQDAAYRAALLPEGVPVFAAEAGVAQGWEALTGSSERVFSIERFGESGPGEEVAAVLNFTADDLAEKLRSI